MAEVVLFHHALGLTPGGGAFADELRRAGHTVHTPDLFEGRTFATLEEGMAHVEEIGFDVVIERGVRAVAGLPPRWSTPASRSAFSRRRSWRRPGRARGPRSCSMPAFRSRSSVRAWPDGVPVQVHGMDADPIFVGEGDIDAARALVASTAQGELFLYPGDQHYFADSSLPTYDADAAALLTQRVLGFLSTR